MGRKTNFQPKVKQLRIWLNKYSRDTFPDVEEKSLALACIKARLWFLSVFLTNESLPGYSLWKTEFVITLFLKNLENCADEKALINKRFTA